ncbi:MAG: DUF420 domain-containing protein [Verrucomicrobiota bacterium]
MKGLDLPLVNACLNGFSAVLLTLGLVFIRQGRREAHQRCMVGALITSSVFLVGYLVHKIFVVKGVHTPFPGPVNLQTVYRVMLGSHIVLAMAVVPLALVTVTRGFRDRLEQHKKIARWTWPIWMYVSVTGVLVYLALYVIWPPVR